MIELTNVTKKFGNKIAVNNFSMHIEKTHLPYLSVLPGVEKQQL